MTAPDFQLFTSLRYDPLLMTLPQNTESREFDAQSTQLSSPFYMPSFHRDRILQAAEHFAWSTAAAKIRGTEGFSLFIRTLQETIDTASSQPLRVRVLLSHDGRITIESSPAANVGEWNLFPLRIPPPTAAGPQMKVSPLTGGALTLGLNDSVHGDPHVSEIYDIFPDTVQTPASPYTTYKTTRRDMYMAARERVGIRDLKERKEVLIVNEEGEVMEGSLTSVFFWRGGKWVTPPLESGGQAGTTRRWALEKGFCGEEVVRVQELVDGEECWISNGVRGWSLGKVRLS